MKYFYCSLTALVSSTTALGQITQQFPTHFDDTFQPTQPELWPNHARFPIHSAGLNGEDVLVADFDGDGDEDVYVVSGGADRYYANGSSTFADPQGTWFDQSVKVTRPGNNAKAGAVGDLDNDGDLDVVLAIFPNAGPGSVLMWNNTGGGSAFTFADASAQIPGGGAIAPANSVALADWTGDGLLDIFVGTTDGIQFWANNNANPGNFIDFSAAFRMLVPALGAGTNVHGLALGDLTNNGEVDLIAGLRTGFFMPAFDVAVANVNLLPTDVTALALPGQVARINSDVELDDVDDDGDLDVVFLNEPQFTMAAGYFNGADVYRTNLLPGGAGFGPEVLLPASNDATQDGELADVDQDGDLDLVTANYPTMGVGGTSGVVRLFLFDAAGWTDGTARVMSPAGVETNGLALIDGDLDSDADLFIVDRLDNSVRYNPNAHWHMDAPGDVNVTGGATQFTVSFSHQPGYLPPNSPVFYGSNLSIFNPGARMNTPFGSCAFPDMNSIPMPTLIGGSTVTNTFAGLNASMAGTTAFIQGIYARFGGPAPVLQCSNLIRVRLF